MTKGRKSPLNHTMKPDYLYSANLNLSKGNAVRDLNKTMVNLFKPKSQKSVTAPRNQGSVSKKEIAPRPSVSGSNGPKRGPPKTADKNPSLRNGGSTSPCLNLVDGSNVKMVAKAVNAFARKKSLSEKI